MTTPEPTTTPTRSPVRANHTLPAWLKKLTLTLGVIIAVIIILVLALKGFFYFKEKPLSNAITSKLDKHNNVNPEAAQLLAILHHNRAKKAALEQKLQKDTAVIQTKADCAVGMATCPDKKTITIKVLSHRLDPISPFTDSGQRGGNNDTVSSGHSVIASVDGQAILHPGYIIQAGQIIHAVLHNAIDSTLPGIVTGHLTRDVWSSDGSRVLLPRGSSIVGHYAGTVLAGQARLDIIWDRVSTPPPHPLAVDLESQTDDALGRAGQKADSIDAHFFQRFGMAALVSMIGAGVSTHGVSDGTQENSANAYQQGIGQSFQAAANVSLAQGLAIPNTIHVYQGSRITITAAKDINLYQEMQVLNYAQ
jgi:type IV secretory pathway VirB10-like protein